MKNAMTQAKRFLSPETARRFGPRLVTLENFGLGKPRINRPGFGLSYHRPVVLGERLSSIL